MSQLNTSEAAGSPQTPINYEKKFGTRKRIIIALLGPLVIVASLCLILISAGLSFFTGVGAIARIAGLFFTVFGIWLPYHAIFGYAESWQVDADAITRFRRNCLWKGQKVWEYPEVKGVRLKPGGKKSELCRPELLTRQNGWMPLPEQRDEYTAEQLKSLIANFKRASKEAA